MIRRVLGAIWLVVAVGASLASLAGGDTSIAGGWLFLAWTLPFGVLWWSYIYPEVEGVLPAETLGWVGEGIVIALAFTFWFILLPKLFATLRRARATHPRDG